MAYVADNDWLSANVTIPGVARDRDIGDEWRSEVPPCLCRACIDRLDRAAERVSRVIETIEGVRRGR